jgi:hypothetical protein
MTKVHFSATFSLPDRGEFILTRGSRQDYGHTVAWLLVDGDNQIVAKGFSRNRRLAESTARQGPRDGRVALYAPVTKGGVR